MRGWSAFIVLVRKRYKYLDADPSTVLIWILVATG
jgi:hypothetical protein